MFKTTGKKKNPGGRPTLEKVVNELDALGVLKPVNLSADLFQIGNGFGARTIKKSAFLQKLSIEQLLLAEAKDWIRACYLVAYESNSFRVDEFSAVDFLSLIHI